MDGPEELSETAPSAEDYLSVTVRHPHGWRALYDRHGLDIGLGPVHAAYASVGARCSFPMTAKRRHG